jgi:hypothetical protein
MGLMNDILCDNSNAEKLIREKLESLAKASPSYYSSQDYSEGFDRMKQDQIEFLNGLLDCVTSTTRRVEEENNPPPPRDNMAPSVSPVPDLEAILAQSQGCLKRVLGKL